jgi:hypothetical protein
MNIRRLVLDVDKATSRRPSLIELAEAIEGVAGVQLHGTETAAGSRARETKGI